MNGVDKIADVSNNRYTITNIQSNQTVTGTYSQNSNTANYGSVIDAPHNATQGIKCGDCHSYSLWWQHSPASASTTPSYAAITDAVCAKCHNSYITHSSIVPGGFNVKCVDCHSAHHQSQIEWRTTDANDLYLVQGAITGNFVVNDGQTTFDYSLVSARLEWSDTTTWSKKNSSLPARGLILVVDTAAATNTYEVIGATESTITIRGGIDQNKAGTTFGLIYGQMIKKSIATSTEGNKEVRFFNPKNLTGGYTDSNSPVSGICQVCHARGTMSWNSSGSGSNSTHASGMDCGACHTMAQGFVPLTEKPIITLNGSSTVFVEVGTAYIDAGATAVDQRQTDLTSAIVVSNPVDTAVSGTYTVAYNVQDSCGNNAVQATRTVTVVVPDTTAPVITLNGPASQTVECAATYTDPGTTVTDDVSVGLTATATGTVVPTAVGAVSTLYYNVQDNAGNSATEVTREVTVQDTTKPTIRLTGGTTVYVPVGGIYTENGATASDACGVSNTVTISGAVDTSTAGTYTLTYDVLDNAGNSANQVTRTVNVLTEDACAGHPSIAGPLTSSVLLTSSTFPNLEIMLSTKETVYDVTGACVPVFVTMTNAGATPINLDASQVASLSNLSIGIYTSRRLLTSNLTHASGKALEPGLFLLPGENTYFSTNFSRERFELYTVPPLGGGVVQTGYSIQGPSGATGIINISLINFTFSVDFGPLPSSRVFEQGAGVDFAPGELLVGFKSGVTLLQAEDIVRQYNCHIVSLLASSFNGMLHVSIPFESTTMEMTNVFGSNPSVQYAERNNIVQLH